jgi:hypothetical protein
MAKDLFGTEYDPNGSPRIITREELSSDLAAALTYKQLRLKYWSEYGAWRLMRQRCYNVLDPRYHDWGGRGIKICKRWLIEMIGFMNFLKDMGPKPGREYTLERKDNDGNYDPGNCKWATMKEQSKNKRTSLYRRL